MLDALQQRRPSLRRSERRVADQVLADPQRALDSSVATLAAAATVSPPTVVRFYQALGYASYQEFKLGLAQELARRTPAERPARLRYIRRELSLTTPAAELAAEVVDGAIDSLQRLRRRLDPQALARAVRLLAEAGRVECYGLGGNAVVAADAQLKLSRLGVAAVAYADPYLHCVSATLLRPGDAVLAISGSGRSKDLLTSVGRAAVAGAKVIAVTAAGSPLSRRADVALDTETDDDDPYRPIRARIAPMLVVDALALGIALARGADTIERLQAQRHALADKFLPP